MRKTYLDNLKWITVLLVLIYHVLYMFNGVEVQGIIGPFAEVQYQDAFQYLVYPWFMLVLFVVSGMCARYSLERHTGRTFIKSRSRKYLVPSTIGLFVFWWILGYYNMAIGGAFEQMPGLPKPILFLIMAVSGTGALWYIQLLWLYSVLLVGIRKIEKDRFYRRCKDIPLWAILLMVIPAWASAQILNTPIVVVYRFGLYGFGFFMGYFVFSHEQVMEKMGEAWKLFAGLALVSGIAFLIVFWGEPYAEHVVLDTPLCNFFAWFGSMGLLSVMKKWGNFETKVSRWMIRKSWGLYLFHYLPLAMCAYYLKMFWPDVPALVAYLVCGTVTFSGAILLYEIISRIPVLKWCVCGIGGK